MALRAAQGEQGMRRQPLTISLSPANPDAVLVLQALQVVERRQRSAELLRWAAGFLSGRAVEVPIITDMGLSEEEFDALLDDF